MPDEVPKKPGRPPKVEVAEKPKPMCNPAELGKHTVTLWENQEVEVGETDLGRKLVQWRNIEVSREEISPLISFDDAKALEECFGEQDWYPFGDQQFSCRFDNGQVNRRFVIDKDTMEKLRG